MNLLEYEAKQLLKNSDVPTPSSQLILDANTHITLPVVLKSQVPTGGRGKHGGVIVATTKDVASDAIKTLFTLPIKGFVPKKILAEELLLIRCEFYLSISIDRDTSTIRLLAHKSGGMEIESEDHESFFSRIISTDFKQVGDELADYLAIPNLAFTLGDIVKKLYHCLIENDATLIEINPLILTTDTRLVAGDAKIVVDDAAQFRHADWKSYEYRPDDSNFVLLDDHGTVATIANGAGLAMATVDAVEESGLHSANFLDIGGGANKESVLDAFRTITKQSSVKAIVINIFAGITRCDEVAKAIIAAKQQIDFLPPLFIRLTGTNADAANTLLNEHHISQFPSLKACISAVKESVEK